ncbi:uncharacterized protein LOC142976904 isoform X2 [Anticarsia gemmatalis]|uniref:uncharacterized protein LOC142976904 isoform X2 n=1 Tax=Anticarsia gemmatalis TaxID=129554 RepID=UPI003F7619FA
MDRITFTVNGEQCTITGTEVSPETSLNEYIRNYLQLHGTKAMCHEGGCGACVVSVTATHPATKEKHVFAVNSCLVSILSCHEWDIKTTEGIGNRKDGYHPIQTTLAAFNGTQCGYCTPGWVMSMYSLLQSNSKLTTKQVENSFAGNICRCTGYRPILDTFKTFARDLEPELQDKIQDLEDLHLTPCVKKCERKCSITEDDWCLIEDTSGSLMQVRTMDNCKWYKAYTIQDVFKVLTREGTKSYRLVAGNTGKGVYPIKSDARVLIDISSIETLKLTISDENLILGAGMSLTDVMNTFKQWSKSNSDFNYLDTLYDHLDLVAHIPVRNIGTIGGNLALKNLHHDFPSDVFLLLETVGATVTVVNNNLTKTEVKLHDFLNADITDKLITEIKLPPLSPNNLIRTYKAVLSLTPNVNPRYKSGGCILFRGVSRASQMYETDKTLWPLNKPVPKIEGLAQCAGEASYTCDVYSGPREVHVAFVLSEVCRGVLEGFDTTEAMKIPGVIDFLSAKDIPGKNTFTPTNVPWMGEDEEIFVTSSILHYGQPLGVIVANSRRLALEAAKLVRVKYKKLDVKPVLCVRDALAAPDKDKRLRQDAKVDPTSKGTDIKYTFSGTFSVPSQYHYTMETQSCNVQIKDSTVVVRSSTQWMDLVNVAVARALGIEENKVLVKVPRIGGGYGGKASRSSQIACACALVAHKLNRAATLVMPIVDNMAAVGKRHQCEFDYECAVNNDGVIQYLTTTYYSDCGCSYNDSPVEDIASAISNLYVSDTYSITGYSVLTDKACNTWCRAPATTEGIAFTEHIMERISHITKKDHIDVRIANLQPKQDVLKDMISSFQKDIDFQERNAAISKYNQENAWKKKGLRLSIMSYPIGYSWNFPVTISVYHADGTIAISHGGIEMGQGINTKVAQVCAYTLKVPLEKVVFRASDSFVSPNAMASNGSITSDSVAFATVKACEKLLKRLAPTKAALNEPTWEEVVKKAYENGINLQSSYMLSPNDNLVGYDVYGMCAAEVELDVLTGNHIIRRLDILEDTGVSMSPEIDLGQIEGAMVMGIGLWTSEHIQYDKKTGRLLTDRTWTYKPPGAKDIPEDFRVKFRPNAFNPAGVLRSKATGEPALVLAVVVTHALHDAILEARKEYGYDDKDWVCVDSPYSIENMLKAVSPKIDRYLLT